MSQLIDGDFASNNGGWQWQHQQALMLCLIFVFLIRPPKDVSLILMVSLSATGYQSLLMSQDRDIHTPSEWAIKTGHYLDYPQPIVDHAKARVTAIASYEEAKKVK